MNLYSYKYTRKRRLQDECVFNSLQQKRSAHRSIEEEVMTISESVGKNVRITLDDGSFFDGIAEYDTSALDNPNGIASICVGDYELYENEIVSIEPVAA